MSNYYRLNIRFDLDDEKTRRAVEYLDRLKMTGVKSRSRFIVDSIIDFMERRNESFTLDDFRQVIREELSEVSFAAPAEHKTVDTQLTEEQKAENKANVLEDLSAFF